MAGLAPAILFFGRAGRHQTPGPAGRAHRI